VDTAASGRCNPEVFSALYHDDPRTAFSFAEAATRLPEVGSKFLGFHLLEELGRGAFARVYLARQGELADRPVVLKVSADVGRESRLLAQLQHANIVPIYSRHRCGSLEAVCMPYLGLTTLADLLRRFQRLASVPTHGRGLVTTLREARSQTRQPTRSAPSDAPAEAVEQPRPFSQGNIDRPVLVKSEQGSTVVLDMLEGMSYVHAVLWLVARLADGLAHAHARGVVHRDLKPANVLITDEGQPMLLDFNLAEDTKVGSSATAAMIGGTLPYMAPEQLKAYQDRRRLSDSRMDVYSLGVILYELLVGRHPFPHREGEMQTVLPAMYTDRLRELPGLSQHNPALSPAVEAILRRCLAPEPYHRYPSALALREDIERQLNDLPLKHTPEPSLRERFAKWRRRHPRLSSVSVVASLAAVLLLSVSIAYLTVANELARHETREAYQQLRDRVADVRFLVNPRSDRGQDRGLELGRAVLRERLAFALVHGDADKELRRLSALDRDGLRNDLGDVLMLCARARAEQAKLLGDPAERGEALADALQWNDQAVRCYQDGALPRVLVRQRAELLKDNGSEAEAIEWTVRAQTLARQSPEDFYLEGRDLLYASKPREAVRLLEEATRRDPRNFWAWYHLAQCHDQFQQNDRCRDCLNVCAALRPNYANVYFNRGLTYLRQQDFVRAAEDFERVIELGPRTDDASVHLAEAWRNLGMARQGQGRHGEAIQDFTRALELCDSSPRMWFTRALAREGQGDMAGGQADRAEGLRREPRDALDWVSRGLARLPANPEGALADLNAALRKDARCELAMLNKAALLEKHLQRTADAIAVYDQWLRLEPDCVVAWLDRGVLRARLGQRAAAHADAAEALRRSPDAPVLFGAGLIYAQTSKGVVEDRMEACRLLRLALSRNYGMDLLEKDEDLAPLRDTPEFAEIRELAKAKPRGW
jgi:serine/threonine protein kinase/predicted Zn-dependent protease